MTPTEQYDEFVEQCGGRKPIRRILIANNGMAARKFILSVRNWCFENFGQWWPGPVPKPWRTRRRRL